MKTTATIASCALLFSMAALANEPETFSELDVNRNGTIEAEEANANAELAANFETADRDQDGRLSQQEYAFAMAKLRVEADPQQRG